jgi:GAF domain-containing protein
MLGCAMGRFPVVEKEIVSEDKRKPVLDEQTLGKLLEAAYVLQEHNRELQEMELGLSQKRDQIEAEDISSAISHSNAPPPTPETASPADYTLTLARIVETQHQIQLRQLDLESAMCLVTERLVQIARASGAAIGILEGKKLRYRAATGHLTLASGTVVPMEKALCLACIRTGQAIRCEDVNPEFLLDSEECRRRGIQSMIAVPIFHDGEVVGGLELYYPTTQAFTDQDVHTCQLMAGLVTEALARDEEVTLKKSRATERAAMLEALEKLKPNLAALTDKPAARDALARNSSVSTVACRKCGHNLVGEEQFCGNCGTPRSSGYEAPSMQSKVASLWHMQEALKKDKGGEIEEGLAAEDEPFTEADIAHLEKSIADSLQLQMPELFEAVEMRGDDAANSSKPDNTPISAEFEDSVLLDLEAPLEVGSEEQSETQTSTALTKSARGTAWSSAASARDFLEQLAPAQRPGALARFWNSRRGDIYLAVAVLLVAAVLRWGIMSDRSVSATGNPNVAAGHRKPAPDADLSMFDRMLIRLGLAEAPPAPEYRGNPDVQVWVDLHTALYYCPGSDLYGKTPKGQFTSQRNAQLDQFEPAYRKTCD